MRSTVELEDIVGGVGGEVCELHRRIGHAAEGKGVGRRGAEDIAEGELLVVGACLDAEDHRTGDTHDIKGVDGFANGVEVGIGAAADDIGARAEAHHEVALHGVVAANGVAEGVDDSRDTVTTGSERGAEEHGLRYGAGDEGGGHQGRVDRVVVDEVSEGETVESAETEVADADIHRDVAAGVIDDVLRTVGPVESGVGIGHPYKAEVHGGDVAHTAVGDAVELDIGSVVAAGTGTGVVDGGGIGGEGAVAHLDEGGVGLGGIGGLKAGGIGGGALVCELNDDAGDAVPLERGVEAVADPLVRAGAVEHEGHAAVHHLGALPSRSVGVGGVGREAHRDIEIVIFQ